MDSLRQASPFGLTKQLCPRLEGAAPPYSGGEGLVHLTTSVVEDDDRASGGEAERRQDTVNEGGGGMGGGGGRLECDLLPDPFSKF